MIPILLGGCTCCWMVCCVAWFLSMLISRNTELLQQLEVTEARRQNLHARATGTATHPTTHQTTAVRERRACGAQRSSSCKVSQRDGRTIGHVTIRNSDALLVAAPPAEDVALFRRRRNLINTKPLPWTLLTKLWTNADKYTHSTLLCPPFHHVIIPL